MVHDIDPSLLQTLARVAKLTDRTQDPWCIFGGAAAALYGAEGIETHDVDVLMSPRDAKFLLNAQGISDFGDGGTDHFRSEIFGKLNTAPLPVDILAGFEVNQGGAWVSVRFSDPQRVDLPAGVVFVPKIEELITLFHICGRPKDLDRAAKLEALKRPSLLGAP